MGQAQESGENHPLGDSSVSAIGVEGNPLPRPEVSEVDIERIERVYR
jgi:hypothetical protein